MARQPSPNPVTTPTRTSYAAASGTIAPGSVPLGVSVSNTGWSGSARTMSAWTDANTTAPTTRIRIRRQASG